MAIHHVVPFTTDIIGVCLNCCMMFIILRYSSDKIGRYKYFLFFYTLNAALYSSTQCLILQNWVVPVNGGYLYLSTVHFLPRRLQIWCVTIWVCFFYTNLFVVCWSFWYRLACVTDSSFFRSKKKLFGMFVFCIFGLAFLAANIITMHPNDRADKFFEDLAYRVNGYSINMTGYIGGPFYYGDQFNSVLFTSLVVHCVANSLFMCFIGYCWYIIGSKIRALESLSQRRFQYRIYVLLTIQTVLPIVFNASPVVIAFTLSALRWDIGDWMLITGMVISFAQMIDPVCMAVLITDYKRAIAKFLRIRLPTSTVSYSVTNQPNKLPSTG